MINTRETNEMYTGALVEDAQVFKLSPWQKFVRLLRGEPSGASVWLGKAWGIDVSRYQESVVIPPGSIDFAVCKMGGSEYSDGVRLDVKFAQHIQAIYDAKAIPMAYWYVDSSWYTRAGHATGDLAKFTNENHPILKVIVEGMRAGNGWKYIKAFFFDVECEGAGDVWNKLYIEDLRDRIVDMQRAGTFPNIPLGIYSRQSFINISPQVGTWCAEHPEIIIWTANYLTSFPGTYKPLAQHKVETLPTVHTPRWFGENPSKPKKYARLWQYHGSFPGATNATCPEVLNALGAPSALDLNVWEIYDRAGLHDALGVPDRLVDNPPPPPPDDDDPPPTDLTEVNARLDDLEMRMDAVEAMAHNTHTTTGGIA